MSDQIQECSTPGCTNPVKYATGTVCEDCMVARIPYCPVPERRTRYSGHRRSHNGNSPCWYNAVYKVRKS
jgi:hypothetical protein